MYVALFVDPTGGSHLTPALNDGAVGAPLAVFLSGVTTCADRCIA